MGPHRVVVVGYDDAELVDIACVTTALALANRLGADPAYQVVLANVTGGPVRCETGLALHAQTRLDAIRRADTVIVSGGAGHQAAARDIELVRQVAMGMVTYLQRPGNQAQMSMFTAARRPDHAIVRRVTDYVLAHPDADLSVEALADRAGVSARQLTRLFREHTGQSPGSAVRLMRLEIAARLAATTDLQLSQIAHRCGFSSAETLRQAFVAKFGVSP